ncbi:exodeoxyribonuclease III [uncultured Pseudoteredinibacter sp.]|uniref:exodeoxyribonuclease III n=1 Tax=uncultured Pseudoteredinibacter sp. TaxID=1641701 RepID=UPI002604E517|nr:exodeoxyribonuclease III [uncultured Pseudoteredinibacter sp.]
MRAISFNTNSIRMRLHQLQALTDTHQPDFIGIQETKVTDEDFPIADIEALGYHVIFHGQKTHYGVALLSKHPFKEEFKGFSGDSEESQRRFIGGRFDVNGREITVLNGYFPQGENREHPVKFVNKRNFYSDLMGFLNENCKPEDDLIVMGDMNISPEDIDIGIGDSNRKRWLKDGKCSFLPEEREWLKTLSDWGLSDSYREIHPDKDDKFSWFDYRSRGFERDPKRGLRIDLIMHTKSLATGLKGADIDYDVRAMEKPSDHCPIWAHYEL